MSADYRVAKHCRAAGCPTWSITRLRDHFDVGNRPSQAAALDAARKLAYVGNLYKMCQPIPGAKAFVPMPEVYHREMQRWTPGRFEDMRGGFIRALRNPAGGMRPADESPWVDKEVWRPDGPSVLITEVTLSENVLADEFATADQAKVSKEREICQCEACFEARLEGTGRPAVCPITQIASGT